MMASEQPWHAAFPPPKPEFTADVMPRQRVLMVQQMKIASMLLIDVRRTDYEGGTIRGSLNIPAHGFYWNMGPLYELAYKANMEWVVFYCGSSRGRGPRCASWFLEHVRNTAGDKDMQVIVLDGGIKNWVKSGPEYTRYMDGYKEDYWKDLFAEEDRQKTSGPEAGQSGVPVRKEVANSVGDGDVTK